MLCHIASRCSLLDINPVQFFKSRLAVCSLRPHAISHCITVSSAILTQSLSNGCREVNFTRQLKCSQQGLQYIIMISTQYHKRPIFLRWIFRTKMDPKTRLDRSQFEFVRSHSDLFSLRSL